MEDELFGFDYAFRDRLGAGLGYSFAETDSNDESRDERHNQVFLEISMAI